MSDNMPRFILRDCTVFINQNVQIGQAKEITIPALTQKTDELRNSGMVMPIAIPMGYEKLELTIKLTSFDPNNIELFGLKVGKTHDYMVTGALANEDGAVTQAIVYMQGRLDKIDPGSWKTGDISECSLTISVRYYKLEIGGQAIVEIGPFDVSINGVSQTADIRQALMV